jgi:acyl-CoA reductase-like NAD-dependent aldehyde dehydrogenase
MDKTKHPIIGGHEIPGKDGDQAVINPFGLTEIGRVSYADAGQMAAAIESAEKAFQSWRQSPARERSAILRKASDGIAARKEELAQQIALEAGKPISSSRGEVDRAVFTFATAADAAMHAGEGRVLDMSVFPSGAGRTGQYRYFPIGIIAAITPFNYPLNLVAHKVAPAIAAGNTIVLKPAPQTPLTSYILFDILRDAGLPAGVLNIVPCNNNVAETLVTSDKIAMVSFTGSAGVGWKLKSLAGKARVALELGGNGAIIVDEVRDMDSLIKTFTISGFNYAGQICVSLQRLYVRRPLYDTVLKHFIEAAKSAVVGDTLDENTVVSPMISPGAAEKVEKWIGEAVADGAVRHSGEFRAPNWITPTVLTNVPSDATICTEEAFAPVVVVEPYDDIDEIIRILNSGQYGLQAGLFSNDLGTIEKVYNELEVGGLIVNDTNSYRIDTMPYGGVKASGFGREGIEFAVREMSEIKMLVTKYN